MRASCLPILVALGVSSCKGQRPADKVVPARIIETRDFTLPLPDGYDDATADLQKSSPQVDVVLATNQVNGEYQTTITVQKVPIPGGSFADPAECARTGKGLMTGGTESPGIKGTLKSTAIIDGPLGKACQIQLLAPQGILLITELHQPGNTWTTPQAVWLMTCNHADGDQRAEATCRSTLAGFRFTR